MSVESSEELEQPGKSQIIWRYMSLEKFLHLVTHQKLYFCRSDLLSDGHELSAQRLFIQREGKIRYRDPDHPDYNEWRKKLHSWEDRINKLKAETYLNSWSLGQDESFALWKLYLGGSSGIAIKSTISRLKKSLENNVAEIYCGKVVYSNEAYDDNVSDELLTCTKTIFYDYEKEFRLYFKSSLEEQKNKYKNNIIFSLMNETSSGFNLDVNADILISEVVFSPYYDGWIMGSIRKILDQIYPPLAKRLRRSEIVERI